MCGAILGCPYVARDQRRCRITGERLRGFGHFESYRLFERVAVAKVTDATLATVELPMLEQSVNRPAILALTQIW